MLRIKELRIDNDLKQSYISNFLGVAQNTYCNYENEKRIIPYDFIIKLAIFYNTSTDYLLGLTDISKPYPRSVRYKRKE